MSQALDSHQVRSTKPLNFSSCLIRAEHEPHVFRATVPRLRIMLQFLEYYLIHTPSKPKYCGPNIMMRKLSATSTPKLEMANIDDEIVKTRLGILECV